MLENRKYGLEFISDRDIYEHVKHTVLQYRFEIDLDRFTENIIDPIKLTFDSIVYQRSIRDVLEGEISRQLDKSNTNQIGYFHENIFKYINPEWIVPKKGYDIINEKEFIYVEIKNKYNTMNSSSAQKIYISMQNTILKNPKAKCLLVEVLAKNSQDVPWEPSVDGVSMSDNRIRRMSIDKFYELVTKDPLAFKNLCLALPKIIEDVVQETQPSKKANTVIDDLQKLGKDMLKSIYWLSFKNYEGFDDFRA